MLDLHTQTRLQIARERQATMLRQAELDRRTPALLESRIRRHARRLARLGRALRPVTAS